MTLLRDPSDLSATELAVWDKLAARSDTPDPMACGSAWQITALACSRRAGAQIVLRQSGNSQVAFALTETLKGYRLGPLEAHWQFGCPLLGPEAVELLADVAMALRKDLQVDRIESLVPGLDPNGFHAKAIDAVFSDVRTQLQNAQAAASLAGGIEGWLSRRSGNSRRNLKRAERRATEHGIWFERAQPASPAQAYACFERMLKIELAGWKGPQRQGLMAIPTFYQKLLEADAARETARIIFARKGSEDVGFCSGSMRARIYRGQQTSYSETVSSLSIGTLMHFETARWLSEDGARLHHFGPIQRRVTYKSSLCELTLPSVMKHFWA